MKSVLISIQPKWCELIASGKKTVEVRKTKPKLEMPFKCYIYCTMPKNKHDNLVLTPFGYDVGSENGYCNYTGNSNGKVIGEFVCDKIVQFENSLFDEALPETVARSCVPMYDLLVYLGKQDYGYGWHISDLVIYDKPRKLSEFYRYCGDNPKCDGCAAHYFSNTECGKEDYCCSIIDGCKPLKRPPQSWCYVERSENGIQNK